VGGFGHAKTWATRPAFSDSIEGGTKSPPAASGLAICNSARDGSPSSTVGMMLALSELLSFQVYRLPTASRMARTTSHSCLRDLNQHAVLQPPRSLALEATIKPTSNHRFDCPLQYSHVHIDEIDFYIGDNCA